MAIFRVSIPSLLLLLAGFVTPHGAFSQDDAGPELQALSFAPRSIDTSAGPAKVTVNFRVAGRDSGAKYFEIGFTGPSTATSYKANTTFAPAASYTGSVSVNFPPLSEPGTWTISFVLLGDQAGYTRFLSPSDVAGHGFPTTLQVRSATDESPPKLTGLRFTPDTIDLTAGPADVAVSLEATDDLSGIAGLEISFLSPSGGSTRPASTSLARPSRLFRGTLRVSFPQPSEAGAWKVAVVVLADSAGNTSVLTTDDLTARGFPSTLQVKKSAEDTTPPTLTALRLSPSSLSAGPGPAAVRVDFTVADDLSGVNAVQFGFVSPSGITRSASANFPPARTFTGSATVQLPPFSEAGDWKIATVVVADAAGNTLVLNAGDLRGKGFPDHVSVTAEAAIPGASASAMQATVFLGTKSREDFVMGFDLRAELYRDGVLAAAGQALCVSGLASNVEAAKTVSVSLDAVPGAPPDGTISVRLLTRIGTNPDGTKCSSASKSTGLRLYFGTTDWPSHVALGSSLDPRATVYLHAAGGQNLLAPTPPTAVTAALSESGSLDFDEGNAWKEIGRWAAAR